MRKNHLNTLSIFVFPCFINRDEFRVKDYGYRQLKMMIITDLGQTQKSAENTTDLPRTLQMPSLCCFFII